MKQDKYGIFRNCLAGDVGKAIQDTKKNKRKLSKRDNNDLQKLVERFEKRSRLVRIDSHDPLIRTVVSCYREYYHLVLLTKIEETKSDTFLLEILITRVTCFIPALKSARSIAKVESLLKDELLKRDYHSLFGRVMPHRSLSVWKSQKVQILKVSLPEGDVRLKVVAVDDLIEHGWMSYATFGKFYSGGWVPSSMEAIYYVKKAYRAKPQRFKVGILAHEGQHMLDLKSYPKLSQSDLEYRAKLVELQLISRPVTLLKKFCSQAGDNRSSPHGFASKILRDNFEEVAVKKLTGKIVRDKARSLLMEHTVKLKKAGFKRVTSVL